MARSSATFTSLPSGPLQAGCVAGRPAAGPPHILRWSPALRERILAAPPEAGRIHSIFERALNILWHDGGLVTLHGPGPLAAPFAAAVTRLPEAGSLTPGAEVLWHDRRILLGPFVLDSEGSGLVDTTIHSTTERPDPLASLLASTPMPVVAPGLCSPSGRSAQCRLADAIVTRDPRTFVEGACALIGLGEGLTPAGDDCLVGALVILHRFTRRWLDEHPEIRAPIADAARAGTTVVGRDFILHALDGAFSEVVFRVVTAPSEHEARQAAAALSEMGSTSGADTMRGMRIALEALSL
ncbi:MAG: DUF2877 domain-containing protein [Candidatus Methylomirabilales bacterium]